MRSHARRLHERGEAAAGALVSSWAQVIYGYTSSGDIRLGWVRMVPGKVMFADEQETLDE